MTKSQVLAMIGLLLSYSNYFTYGITNTKAGYVVTVHDVNDNHIIVSLHSVSQVEAYIQRNSR